MCSGIFIEEKAVAMSRDWISKSKHLWRDILQITLVYLPESLANYFPLTTCPGDSALFDDSSPEQKLLDFSTSGSYFSFLDFFSSYYSSVLVINDISFPLVGGALSLYFFFSSDFLPEVLPPRLALLFPT